ncbi:Uncharacterized protein BP5553_07372 [Venustampulla echinocandica]|uniref:Fringe-like glycosyltransferase domain-containing protein n=1 Tax=Venustampulla echinocandica TaxID=2656787 RepID=A0A370TJ98_9HELO|nr:Uncharacterized protein BP5553_07372 [Venustampulla echinocandica]RDL35441.1 Uncharacterized protein BP5553_07372 [Venustampulla echinocandica]
MKLPTLMNMGKCQRLLFLSILVCYLGTTAIYSIVPRHDRGTLLHPLKSFLGGSRPNTEPQTPHEGLGHLAKYNLTPTFEYSRRTIQTKYFEGPRSTLTVLDKTNLFGDWQTLSLEVDDLSYVALEPELPPLTLHVPSSPEVDTSIISFGIATNVQRLPDAIPQLKHWLPHTESSLHILVPPSDKIPTLQKQMNDLGINTSIKESPLEFAKSYFALVKELYEKRTPDTKWLVLIDDDTFVPSLAALLTRLNKAYDPSDELLIAAMSDNMKQIQIFGLLPYGGGGVFISVPLAAKLVEPKVWDACMEIPDNQGDQIVAECLRQHSAVRPTFDPGLNQMDISGGGDVAAGYYESGRQMLTVHHWRSPQRWYDIDTPTVSYVSKACGDEGVLMRWLFKGDIVLSNGYSIAEYPNGIEITELEKIEHTWPEELSKFEHRIGPLRKKMNSDDKRTLKMVDTEILEGYGVRQTYLEQEETEQPTRRNDRVLELLWEL